MQYASYFFLQPRSIWAIDRLQKSAFGSYVFAVGSWGNRMGNLVWSECQGCQLHTPEALPRIGKLMDVKGVKLDEIKKIVVEYCTNLGQQAQEERGEVISYLRAMLTRQGYSTSVRFGYWSVWMVESVWKCRIFAGTDLPDFTSQYISSMVNREAFESLA